MDRKNYEKEKNYTKEFIKEKYKKQYNQNGRLGDSIDDMIRNFDFKNLNNVVKSGVDLAFNEENRKQAVKAVKDISSTVSGYISNNVSNIKGMRENVVSSGYDLSRYSNKPSGFAANIILQLISYPMGILMILLGGVMQFFNATPILAYVLGGAFMLLGGVGTYKTLVISRYRKYLRYFQNKEFSKIDEMSRRLNIGVATIVGDIKNMIRKNILTEASLVDNNSLLLITKDSFHEYEKESRAKLAEEAEKEKLLNNKELNEFMENTSISVEDMLNITSQIDDVIVKELVSNMKNTIDNIKETVKKYPENLGMLNRFSSYYLPTTVRLLITFDELEENPDKIASAAESKEEIKKALQTIAGAYDTLLDKLISVKSMDINADISVLNTMLSQDGLK